MAKKHGCYCKVCGKYKSDESFLAKVIVPISVKMCGTDTEKTLQRNERKKKSTLKR